MKPDSNRNQAQIFPLLSRPLARMAAIWCGIALLMCLLLLGRLPGGLPSLLQPLFFSLGVSSFLWLPLIFIAFCVGKGIAPIDVWRFLAVTVFALTVTTSFLMYFVAHAWLD